MFAKILKLLQFSQAMIFLVSSPPRHTNILTHSRQLFPQCAPLRFEFSLSVCMCAQGYLACIICPWESYLKSTHLHPVPLYVSFASLFALCLRSFGVRVFFCICSWLICVCGCGKKVFHLTVALLTAYMQYMSKDDKVFPWEKSMSNTCNHLKLLPLTFGKWIAFNRIVFFF